MKTMKKVNEFVNTSFIYAIWMLTILSMIVNFRSCGVSKDNRKLRQEVEILQVKHDSLKSTIGTNFYSKEELDIRMAIEGYEISKRMLYDNNTVIRTSRRPDDIMIQYDKRIKELRDRLKND